MQKRTIRGLLALISGCLLVQAQTHAQTNPPAPSGDDTNAQTPAKQAEPPVSPPSGQQPALPRGNGLKTPSLAASQNHGRGNLALAQADAFAQDAQNNAAEQVQWAKEQADRALQSINLTGGRDSSRSRTVVVGSTQTNAETLITLDEDLKVMSRILDKAVAASIRHDPDQALGIDIVELKGSHGPQNFYIEGVGALFIREVNLALLPGKAKETGAASPKKDSAWEEAKRELYGAKNKSSGFGGGSGGGSGGFNFGFAPRKDAPPYNAEKIERLKKELAKALKNGANIRGLGSNDTLTVVLLGAKETVAVIRADSMSVSEDGTSSTISVSEDGGNRIVSMGRAGGQQERRQATLTVKVKKSDAEAAFNGSIDLDELQKRAVIAIY